MYIYIYVYIYIYIYIYICYIFIFVKFYFSRLAGMKCKFIIQKKKKNVLKNFPKFTAKHLCQNLFFINVAD